MHEKMIFANNQKELDNKIEQIQHGYEEKYPDKKVEIEFLNPQIHDIEFTKNFTTQMIIGIKMVG
ncbi:hypothetical protein CVD28_25695 [Bacillus sp. M6-12]|uniref:hypothetical protein n=1 Tax=Bacillus sp. M6-12 TaxID=2054166 RepID=UPI000C791E23|nr:hypothetical protein [Bacillus sp. M6-12]PLS14914.1 hypothetical protein CVD28_25695 [Bacillus sp. M6-12]